MYKFNNNNIITGYIKELLHAFNLPQTRILRAGLIVHPNVEYIYKSQVYKYIGKSRKLIASEDLQTLTNFTVIEPYLYNVSILNKTRNLIISGPLYDSYTHNYLGDYLRFKRDYQGINLMSMYNCFNEEMPHNLDIEVDNLFSLKSSEEGYKIYAVPVKFYQDYTIGIDCDTSIEIVAGLYSNGEILITDETRRKEFYRKTYMKKIGSQFKKPFVYRKLKNISAFSDETYNAERYLVLYLKVPISCKSSITILEGDYSLNTEYYFDEGREKLSQTTPLFYKQIDTSGEKVGEISNYNYISKLQLLNFNSGSSSPFADRLVEYLLGNVVDSTDDIGENIKRVQSILIKNNSELRIKKYGEWDEEIRKTLYKEQIKTGLVHTTFDSIGYYDKDLEEALRGIEETLRQEGEL